MPLPRVDVRPRRLAARRAALRSRAGLRQGRLVAAAGERRHLGAVPVREPEPRCGAAVGVPRRPARDHGARPRPVRSSCSTRASRSAPTRTGRSSSRTSSSATTARPRTRASAARSTFTRTATCSRRIRRSPRSTARRARPRSAASSTCCTRTSASTSSPARRTCRSARSSRTAPGAPSATWTTSSLPDVDAGWLEEFFAFDDQVGREDADARRVRAPRHGLRGARARPAAAERRAAASPRSKAGCKTGSAPHRVHLHSVQARGGLFVKRLFALAAIAALAFTIAAVAGARTTAAPTMTPGTLVIGFGDPAVNFANGKVSGSNYINPKGFEVDLSTQIAKDLGLTPKYVFTPWEKLFAPGHKSFDISFQEATITAQRKKTVDFTSSYFDANQGVLLSKKATDAALARRPEAGCRPARRPTRRASPGSSRSCTRRRRRTCTRRRPPRSSRSRSAGATRSSWTRRSSRPRRRRGRRRYGAIAGQIITHEQYGAVLQKGSKLTPVVDAEIAKLWKNGTIGKLQKKWFNVDFSKVPVLKQS